MASELPVVGQGEDHEEMLANESAETPIAGHGETNALITLGIVVVVIGILVMFGGDVLYTCPLYRRRVLGETSSPPAIPNMLGRKSVRRNGGDADPNDVVDAFFKQAGNFRCPQEQYFTKKEIAAHKTGDDLWIVVDGNVLDVSMFISQHPGGALLLSGAGGEDCAALFSQYHHPSSVSLFPSFCIGRLKQE